MPFSGSWTLNLTAIYRSRLASTSDGRPVLKMQIVLNLQTRSPQVLWLINRQRCSSAKGHLCRASPPQENGHNFYWGFRSLSLSPPLFPCDLTYLVREVHRIPGLDLAWGQTHVLDHPVWNFPIALGKPIVRCIGFPKLAMSIYVASGNQTMQWNIPYIWNLLEPLVGKSSKSTFGYRMVRMG